MGAKQVVGFMKTIEYEKLPREVQTQAKRAVLDTLGALLAGSKTPVAEMVKEFALAEFPGQEGNVLATGAKVSRMGAALANGIAANALDIDDGHNRAKGHPGACVLPALFAAAEGHMIPGKKFLAAVAVGYETGIQAAVAQHSLLAMYHGTGSWGAIAAAAGVGYLLDLSSEQLEEALGTAEYHAPISPIMKSIAHPCQAKDGIGWAAMSGLAAALLARRSFTGIVPALADLEIPLIGAEFEFLNIYAKPYAACRWAHPAIAAALKIQERMKARRIGLEDITKVAVFTFEAANKMSREHPKNTEEAQFNIAFPIAAALADGRVGPAQVLPPLIFDQKLLQLADKVETVSVSEYEAVFPGRRISRVEITTRNGAVLDSGDQEAKWDPFTGLPTNQELEEKFRWLVDPILGTDRTNLLVKTVWDLDKVDDMQILIDLCQP